MLSIDTCNLWLVIGEPLVVAGAFQANKISDPDNEALRFCTTPGGVALL